MGSKSPQLATLVVGALVLFATMAAYIYCEQNGVESGPLLGVSGPVIAALLLQQSIARVERKADQAVENTNGKLDGGIRDAVRAELHAQLDARGLGTPVTTPDTTTAGDPTQPR